MLKDSIFMTPWKRQNYRDREQISGYWRLGWGKDSPQRGLGDFFIVMELALYLH